MSPVETKQIMYDSPEAAKIVTITGWQSSNGHFWGDDEHMARYDGSTHKKCECGVVIGKQSYCNACYAKRQKEEWLKMPLIEWDGICMIAIHDDDRYFSELDEFLEYCEENDILPGDVMLVATEGDHLREVETDYWEEQMPEDGELPGDIQNKLDELNKAIRERSKPFSWERIKKRIIISTPADWKTD